ncbi:uncharacterized protein [Watersipora subatra]|uniref:uncharacterized protein n=1 Tax=Watersipora subatra TaxID=2589382 RepID=UPI00355C7754
MEAIQEYTWLMRHANLSKGLWLGLKHETFNRSNISTYLLSTSGLPAQLDTCGIPVASDLEVNSGDRCGYLETSLYRVSPANCTDTKHFACTPYGFSQSDYFYEVSRVQRTFTNALQYCSDVRGQLPDFMSESYIMTAMKQNTQTTYVDEFVTFWLGVTRLNNTYISIYTGEEFSAAAWNASVSEYDCLAEHEDEGTTIPISLNCSQTAFFLCKRLLPERCHAINATNTSSECTGSEDAVSTTTTVDSVTKLATFVSFSKFRGELAGINLWNKSSLAVRKRRSTSENSTREIVLATETLQTGDNRYTEIEGQKVAVRKDGNTTVILPYTDMPKGDNYSTKNDKSCVYLQATGSSEWTGANCSELKPYVCKAKMITQNSESEVTTDGTIIFDVNSNRREYSCPINYDVELIVSCKDGQVTSIICRPRRFIVKRQSKSDGKIEPIVPPKHHPPKEAPPEVIAVSASANGALFFAFIGFIIFLDVPNLVFAAKTLIRNLRSGQRCRRRSKVGIK